MNTEKPKSILLIGSIYFDIPSTVGNYQIKRIGMVKKCNWMDNIMRGLSLRLNLKNKSKYFLIDEAAEQASKSDIVVLFDSTSNDILTEYASNIENRVDHNKTELFFYFWNTIDSLNGLKLSDKWEVTTFDKTDALKYSFRYIGSFYCLSFPASFLGGIPSDVFFVGTDKGRFNFIRSLERKLVKEGLETKFIYVAPIKSRFSKRFCSFVIYPKVVNYIAQTKTILDITRVGQFGLTLRFFEGIYFNKKILTNHYGVKHYKFYNPQNIMVINENTPLKDIKTFIENSIVPYSEELKNIYSLELWLKRLIDSSICFDDTNL